MRARWALPLLAVVACGDDNENGPGPAKAYSAFDEITTTNQGCLPRPYKADSTGKVPLRFVVTLPGSDSKCMYGSPSNEATRSALSNDLGTSVGVACEIPQLAGDCEKSQSPGWCYVSAGNGAGCVAHAYLSIGAAPISGPDRRYVVLEP
jgi:hypothetical protein